MLPFAPQPLFLSRLCAFNLIIVAGMKVKTDRDEATPYAAMLAAQDVAVRCKELGINAIHIKIRGTGGTRQKAPGPGVLHLPSVPLPAQE